MSRSRLRCRMCGQHAAPDFPISNRGNCRECGEDNCRNNTIEQHKKGGPAHVSKLYGYARMLARHGFTVYGLKGERVP